MFTFKTNAGPLIEDPILITGVQRSGTSLLGSLVGSLTEIEYDYEPWIWGNLPIMAQSESGINEAAVKVLLEGYTYELFSNHVLARNVNMRKTDMSCKAYFKSENEVQRRWENLHDRTDVRKWVKENNIKLSFKLVNAEPFIQLFLDIFPKGKVIHIVRDPFDAALSAAEKGWMNLKEFSSVESADVRKVAKGKGDYFFPWWLKDGDEDRFLAFNEAERALYAWTTVMESFSHKVVLESNYHLIRYENLISNGDLMVSELCSFLGKSKTPLTEQIAHSIKKDNSKKYTEELIAQWNSDLVQKALGIFDSFETVDKEL